MTNYFKFYPVEFKRKKERKQSLTQRDYLVTTEPIAAAKTVASTPELLSTTKLLERIKAIRSKDGQPTEEEILALTINIKRNLRDIKAKLSETGKITIEEVTLLWTFDIKNQ